ncbi:MAG: PHP domain-containing protein [Clostridia bacterium]|nr:PHP domain-containing protein [Clostridia bacterium]
MFVFDAHIHTLASGHHTTDRVIDVVKAAKSRGILAVGITEHAHGMLNGCTESGFRSLMLSPRDRLGVKVLFGAEANVMAEDGTIDLSPAVYDKLDYVITSLHKECFRPRGEEINTKALIFAMEKKNCDVVGHPADKTFPLNLPALVKAAKQNGVIIELNEASVRENGYRGDNRPQTRTLIRLCKQFNVPVVLGSDSHGGAFVGDFTTLTAMLKEEDFPKTLILNDCIKRFLAALPRNKG